MRGVGQASVDDELYQAQVTAPHIRHGRYPSGRSTSRVHAPTLSPLAGNAAPSSRLGIRLVHCRRVNLDPVL